MATGYWRIKVVGGVFQLQDHTPNATAREDLLLKVNTPNRHTVPEEETLLDTSTGVDAAAEQLIVSNAGYNYVLAQPWGNPLEITPSKVPSITTSTFPDGLYRFQVDYSFGGTTYSFDEYTLYLATIDTCISTKLDTYLASSCDKCKETQQLQTLQELVSLRTGAQLDVNAARYTAAERKVTLMSNICTGSSCTCICGCS